MNRKIKIISKFCVCFGICFLVSVANSFAQISYEIVPGVKVGAITAKVSESDLKKIYGSQNVKSDEIGLGEGDSAPGTVIFQNDPTRKLEIVWKNEKMKKFPKFIQLWGEKSLWKTKQGISLGTDLKTLERLNGKPFVLAGFEWDEAGGVTSWKGGKLAKQKLGLRLNPAENSKVPQKVLDSVAGDGVFSSSNKAMQRINPKVYFIYVEFP